MLFPWLGVDLVASPGLQVTACALAERFSKTDFPLQRFDALSSKAVEWLAGNTVWTLPRHQAEESFTNFDASLVAAAVADKGGRLALCLFAGHSGQLLRLNPQPLGNQSAESITRLGFSPNGGLLAAYTSTGDLCFYQTNDLRLVRRYEQIDARCRDREVALRMAWNYTGDKFLAYHRGDLVVVDLLKDSLLRVGVPSPVAAYAYTYSYDSVDTAVAVCRNSHLYTFRLDGITAAREAKYQLAGFYPQATFANFSSDGHYLTAIATEAEAGWNSPPVGKQSRETHSRLLVWKIGTWRMLDPVKPRTTSWRLTGGRQIQGRFLRLDRRADGWHLVLRVDNRQVEVPSRELHDESIDTALLESSFTRSEVP